MISYADKADFIGFSVNISATAAWIETQGVKKKLLNRKCTWRRSDVDKRWRTDSGRCRLWGGWRGLLECWAKGDGGKAEIAEEGGLSAKGLEAVPPVETKRREVVGVDGEGESSMRRGGDDVCGMAHEQVGDTGVAVLRRDAEVDQFDHVGARESAEE